ncbi:MAG: hypothetical protein ACTHM6_12465 [Tepidisphaeraceae bacterium]
MIRAVHCIVGGLLCGIAGCAIRAEPAPSDRVTIFVPGVFGDGPWYNDLVNQLGESVGPVKVFTWGMPKPLFVANFSSAAIHADAEASLARAIDALPASVKTIDLVAHSAGCGVVLGGLAQSHRRADQVVLIAPSVSPTYDLRPALEHTTRAAHVFYSSNDTLFLHWRTGHFGTYDDRKCPAAGYAGFDVASLDPADRQRLVQHAYDPHWQSLGNAGGHGGALAGPFIEHVLTPLLRTGDQPG